MANQAVAVSDGVTDHIQPAPAPTPPHGAVPVVGARRDDICRALVEQVQVGLFVAQAGRLSFVNAKLTAMLGYTSDEMQHGMAAQAIATAACQSRLDAYLQRLSEELPAQSCDIQCQHKSGRVFDARMWASRARKWTARLSTLSACTTSVNSIKPCAGPSIALDCWPRPRNWRTSVRARPTS